MPELLQSGAPFFPIGHENCHFVIKIGIMSRNMLMGHLMEDNILDALKRNLCQIDIEDD